MNRLRLRRVISGGQTGADRTGLEEAQRLGLATGGTVPRGCRTDEGPDRDLVTRFGCVEHTSSGYPQRTERNVIDSDVTVWFGDTSSPGGRLTRRLCHRHGKQFLVITRPALLVDAAMFHEVINVAGNRRRTNPNVVADVRAAFALLERYL